MMEKDIFIKKENGNKLFTNILENDINDPNVIYIPTPLMSVVELKESYYPLSNYGLNVFALDFSGIGKSEGEVKDITIESIHDDIDTCIKYIKENYNSSIHMFGASGTGGAIVQHYSTGNDSIKSLIQYGVANYKDASPLIGESAGRTFMIKMLNPILSLNKKLRPNLNIYAKPPEYNGINAEKESEWFEEHKKEMHVNINLFKAMLDIFLSKSSNIKDKPKCPVLVFAPKHDRYFSFTYIKKYYNWLDEPKEIYEIDDSHLSFIWRAEEICKKASDWFYKYS